MALGEITETRTYLTFTLDQEDFAVDVAGVKEVLDFTNVTRVPRTPDFMKGVINLRGSVVPVVDMRLKFGLPETEKTVDTCVIVLEVELDGEVAVIGAIADSVKEVFELDSVDIEPPPRLGTRMETEFISGMGKHNDDFIIILDVNRVFSTQEMELFRQAEDLSQPLPDPDHDEEDPPRDADEPAAELVTQSDEKPHEIPEVPDRVPEKPDAVTEPAKKTARTVKTSRKSTSRSAGKITKKTGKPTVKKS
jgi:purine-binding chemotaxis protein CheW